MPKRRISSEYEESVIEKFKNSTSYFGKHEENALRIKIQEVDVPIDIFIKNPDFNTPFELSEFTSKDIITFDPLLNIQLSKSQRVFLTKFKKVLINSQDSGIGKVEAYVQDMVDFLLLETNLEDGMYLEMMPCLLYLTIQDNNFAAFSDKEGRKGDNIIWILEESKHRFDNRYKQGDIQLVGSLIAAAQHNFSIHQRIIPEFLYGIKVVGYKMFFYRMKITQAYLESISTGLPEEELIVIKYPKGNGLLLTNSEDRKEIFSIFENLRNYALNI